LALAAGPLTAQESGTERDTLNFYGLVAAITQTQLTVYEYDWDQEKNVEVVYQIHPQVKLENIPSLRDIRKGDMVLFTYISEMGNHIIIDVLVSKPDEEQNEQSRTGNRACGISGGNGMPENRR
jgi:hypothetical protein